MEAQLDLLKEKLESHKLGSFERMTGSLTENLAALQQIVLDTMEESRNLHAIDGIDLADQQWSIEHRLQQTMSDDQRCAQLEQELAHCHRIATAGDISALRMRL